MWMSTEAARSDVVLAPAGLWVGGQVISLLVATPLWPRNVLGAALLAALTVVVAIGWPLWLARMRDDSVVGGGLAVGDLVAGLVASLPLFGAGVAIAWLQGAGLASLSGIGASLGMSLESLLVLAMILATALGSWLVITLVARRAAQGYGGVTMSSKGILRTYGLAMAGGTTLLLLLATATTRARWWSALLIGVGLALVVLLVDGLLAGRDVDRTVAFVPAIVAAVLWVFRGGLLLGGDLLTDLASAALGATIALCMGLLVQEDRAWAALPLPLVLALWAGAGVLPLLG